MNLKEKLRSKKVKYAAAAVIVLVLLVAALPLLSRGAQRQEEAVQTIIASVETQRPGVKNIQNTDELIGTIEPKNSAYVYPQISGEVQSVSIKTGDTVSAGQILCTIENSGQTAAASSVETAEINLRDAQSGLERTRLLYESGGVSQEAYEQAQSAYQQAQVQYNSAQNSYSDQVGFSQITAPISGRIESFDIKAHDNVNGQSQICIIAGGDERMVRFSATENIKNNLKTGDYIKVEKNGAAYDAIISEISSMVKPETGLFEIKADVINGQELATNSSVKITLVSEESSGTLSLPLSAVYYDGGDAFVYVNRDNTAYKISVQTGISNEEHIAIQSGLSAEDEVITTWSASLRDGAQVMVKTQNQTTTGGAAE